MRKGTLALALFLFALLLAPAALADSLTLTLANPTQAGAPGSTFSFTATVAAPTTNTAAIFLNGDSFNLLGAGRTLNDSGFFNNFPLSLTPGQSFTGLLFTIGTTAASQRGPFSGTFSILGGSNASTYNPLSTVSYAVNVTPEPSSLLLLGTGATGALGLLRRRRA